MAGHVVPKKLYYNVFGLLMILTLVTTLVAFADLGPLNTIVALTIAVGKAIVVTLFFMHVRYSSRLTWIVVGAGRVLAGHHDLPDPDRLPHARLGIASDLIQRS